MLREREASPEWGLLLAWRGMSGARDDARIEVFLERARGVFPNLRVSRDAFVEYLSRHAAHAEALAHEGDEALLELYLAAGLDASVPAAARAFEERYLAPLGASLGRLGLSSTELDEVKQRVREKLLVKVGSQPPRVEQYAGRGRLAGLMQVVATREALTMFRKSRREAPLAEDSQAGSIAEAWDPGLEMLKGRAREAFRAAFAQAVRSLEPRERNLLRLHLLGGVTLEQLAKLYGVHRATVVRWLAAARERVLDDTKKAIGAELGLRGGELESVMNAARSRLDLSVEHLFRSDPSLAEPDEPGPEGGGLEGHRN